MSHLRTQIRDAAAALLPGTVYTARVYPVQEASLPVTLVVVGQEEIEAEDFGVLNRRLAIIIECIVQGDDLDAALNSALVGVEAALGNSTLGGRVLHLLPVSIEVTQSAEGSAPIGRARMTYEALYRTSPADPETII